MFQNKDVVPLKTFPTEKALAVAFAAQRINSGKYVKHTRRFSEEENKTQFSNKELVKYYFKPVLANEREARASRESQALA